MNSFQKVIKYIAIAFAFFLIFSIFSGIVYGIKSVYYIFNDNNRVADKFYDLSIDSEIKELDIDVKAVNLIVKSGEQLKIETNNNYISSKQNESKFLIKEKDINTWFNDDNTELIIYIPNDTVFDKVSITTGAGKVDIDELTANVLNLKLGAGKLEIGKLNISDKTVIDGGAGSVLISNGSVNNLDLDIGVGKVEFNAKLLGNTDIDCGIGEFILSVNGEKDNYKINVDKGIGNFKIDNNSIDDDTTYGNGNNIIDIDGGIGNIIVEFTN